MEKCSLTGINLNKPNVNDDVYIICSKHPIDRSIWENTRFAIRDGFINIIDCVKYNENVVS